MQDSNIYVLSIGINQYKSQKVSNLNGCILDVNNLHKTISEIYQIPENNYITLKDNKATRQKIIETFREHFSQLDNGDIALFHFSGHGSREIAPKAFPDNGYEDMLESLVCYDSCCDEVYNLTDKEIRLLIREVTYHKSGIPKDVQFIGLIDACHSGSLFRDKDWTNRLCNFDQRKRQLSDLLDGKFQLMLEKQGRIILPFINYILFSACGPNEMAQESESGGLFTNTFLKVLKDNLQYFQFLTYADLHFRCHQLIENESNHLQNPVLQQNGRTDPHNCFLSNRKRESQWPRLTLSENQWIVNVGIIHGINPSDEMNKYLEIFHTELLDLPIGRARVHQVNLEFTIVIPEWIEKAPPESINSLCINLFGIGLPINYVIAENQAQNADSSQQNLAAYNPPNYCYLSEHATYELERSPNQLALYKNQNKSRALISGISSNDSSAFEWMNRKIFKIAKWENFRKLVFAQKRILDFNSLDLKFSYWTINSLKKKVSTVYSSSDQEKPVDKIKIPFLSKKYPIYYKIEFINKIKYANKVYCYLFHLDETYNISPKHEEHPQAILYSANRILYNSEDSCKALAITNDKSKQSIDTFMVLVSTQQIAHPYLFQQEGLGHSYQKIVDASNISNNRDGLITYNTIKAEWAFLRFDVILNRV